VIRQWLIHAAESISWYPPCAGCRVEGNHKQALAGFAAMGICNCVAHVCAGQLMSIFFTQQFKYAGNF
jgi:hypothetical protein